MAENKWYSNGLTAEEAARLNKRYLRITDTCFGLSREDILALELTLNGPEGYRTSWRLEDPKDIKELFVRTGTRITADLKDKFVETLYDKNLLRAISVDEGLVTS